MRNNKDHQKGFTIIELLIASTIFSVILLIVSAGVIAISRNYYKGITSSRTQETARTIVDDVAGSVRFNGGLPKSGAENNGYRAYCIGKTRYTYKINQQIRDGGPDHALFVDNNIIEGEACTALNLDSLPAGLQGRELVGQNMRLLNFVILPAGGLSKVSIGVAYGDNDLLTHYGENASQTDSPISAPETGLCRSGIAGSNFCAVSNLEISVKSRKI